MDLWSDQKNSSSYVLMLERHSCRQIPRWLQTHSLMTSHSTLMRLVHQPGAPSTCHGLLCGGRPRKA